MNIFERFEILRPNGNRLSHTLAGRATHVMNKLTGIAKGTMESISFGLTSNPRIRNITTCSSQVIPLRNVPISRFLNVLAFLTTIPAI